MHLIFFLFCCFERFRDPVSHCLWLNLSHFWKTRNMKPLQKYISWWSFIMWKKIEFLRGRKEKIFWILREKINWIRYTSHPDVCSCKGSENLPRNIGIAKTDRPLVHLVQCSNSHGHQQKMPQGKVWETTWLADVHLYIAPKHFLLQARGKSWAVNDVSSAFLLS